MIIKAATGSTIPILSSGKHFWGLIVGQDIWKETGYGTIIYLAALAGVDQEMYEAARVDGAGRWQMMWNITLPAIKSTVIIMLILRVGSILNTGYEQIFLMRNDLNVAFAEVFDTFIYTRGIQNAQYSFSTAAGMFKSIVGMIMVLGANYTAKKAGESGIY
jgi:putative aldouronate transport system permease protein